MARLALGGLEEGVDEGSLGQRVPLLGVGQAPIPVRPTEAARSRPWRGVLVVLEPEAEAEAQLLEQVGGQRDLAVDARILERVDALIAVAGVDGLGLFV